MYRPSLLLAAVVWLASATGAGAQDCGPLQTSTAFPNGALVTSFVVAPDHRILSEVVLWIPSSQDARSVWMTGRWEAHAPATIDWRRGLAMLDSQRLWQSKGKRPPRGLTLELRVNSSAPWEGYGALRGNSRLQFGVRLSADWTDVRAMAEGSERLYLVTRRKKAVMDTVQLSKADFAVPIADADAVLARDRAAAVAAVTRCEPNGEIVVTDRH